MKVEVAVGPEALAAVCHADGIGRLALVGSALRPEFRPAGDVDVLAELDTERVPSLLRMARLEPEPSRLFGGRKVDLRAAEDLSRQFRQQVMAEAEVCYAAE